MSLEKILKKLDKQYKKHVVSRDLREYLSVLIEHGIGSDEEYLAYTTLIGKNPDYSVYVKYLRRQYRLD